MTAAAYRYADGGKMSPELKLLNYIDRFGVKPVMGRDTLYAREMREMIHAENIVNAYRERNKENAADWVKDNPEMSEILRKAQRMVEDA